MYIYRSNRQDLPQFIDRKDRTSISFL
jgi:hypothetical protein